MNYTIRGAGNQDITLVKNFLGQANVSSEGIEKIVDNFLLMIDEGGNLLATMGIERVERDGLLRSLVITPSLSQTDMLALFQRILKLAKEKEIEHLYLATNKHSSIAFFQVLGFHVVHNDHLPNHLLLSEHVQHSMKSEQATYMKVKL